MEDSIKIRASIRPLANNVIYLMSTGEIKTIKEIESYMKNSNIIEYICGLNKNTPFQLDCFTYGTELLNDYLNNYLDDGTMGREGQKYFTYNENDGLLFLLAFLMDTSLNI